MSQKDKELDRQLDTLAVLGEPVRRALYFHVVGKGGEVSREDAKSAVRISRSLAAFHLDKLVEAGLLDVSFRRLSGRSGPGAGRPTKLYRRAARPIAVALPDRRFEVGMDLMARALDGGGPQAAAALEQVALARGEELGQEARQHAEPGDEANLRKHALDTLRAAGFEPRRNLNGEIVLRNCPFDAIRSTARETICTMNLALCRGLVQALAQPGWNVRLEPDPERCCVVIQAGES
jgi:predicted ArsR family transcriptional regulator